MLESLLLVTVLRLEGNCTHQAYQFEREKMKWLQVYYIVVVHMYAFYLHLLVIF